MKKIILLFYLFLSPLLEAKEDLMLVGTYQGQNLTGWVMSEKLDGVRGFWDGKTLLTRQYQLLNPPTYFIQDFPPFAIDGELFSQRNRFAEISGIVRAIEDKGWHKLKLYVFDVPNAEGDLFQRLQKLRDYLQQHPSQYIEIIEQIPIKDNAQMRHFLRQVEQKQGEGIVVRNPQAPYQAGRSEQILKVKTTLDEECTVIAHHRGKGRFLDMLGSITCENQRGQFKIGSGFTLADRQHPPQIGSQITYKYRGLTKTGKPRFATYWRAKPD